MSSLLDLIMTETQFLSWISGVAAGTKGTAASGVGGFFSKKGLEVVMDVDLVTGIGMDTGLPREEPGEAEETCPS